MYPLPVSHAFHSRNCGSGQSSRSASVLTRSSACNPPRRPITTNVTGEYYPTGPGAGGEASSTFSPSRFSGRSRVDQPDGADVRRRRPRVPRVWPQARVVRDSQSAFFKRRPHRALYTNHPKRGGSGQLPRLDWRRLVALGAPRATASPGDGVRTCSRTPQPRRATTQAITAFAELHQNPNGGRAGPQGRRPAHRGSNDHGVQAPKNSTWTMSSKPIWASTRSSRPRCSGWFVSTYGIAADPELRRSSQHRTLRSLIQWAADRTGATRIAVAPQPAPAAPADPSGSRDPRPRHRLTARCAAIPHCTPLGPEWPEPTQMRSRSRSCYRRCRGSSSAAFDGGAIGGTVRLLRQRPRSCHGLSGDRACAAWPANSTPRGSDVPHSHEPANRVHRSLDRAARWRPRCSAGRQLRPDLVGRIVGSAHIGDRTKRVPRQGPHQAPSRIHRPARAASSRSPRTDEVIRLAGTEAAFDLTELGRSTLASDRSISTCGDASSPWRPDSRRCAMQAFPLVRMYKTTERLARRVPSRMGPCRRRLRDGTGRDLRVRLPRLRPARPAPEDSGGRNAEGQVRSVLPVPGPVDGAQSVRPADRGARTEHRDQCGVRELHPGAGDRGGLDSAWGRCERVIVVGADDVTSRMRCCRGLGVASWPRGRPPPTTCSRKPRFRSIGGGMGSSWAWVRWPWSSKGARVGGGSARGRSGRRAARGHHRELSAFHGTRLDVEHIAGRHEEP